MFPRRIAMIIASNTRPSGSHVAALLHQTLTESIFIRDIEIRGLTGDKPPVKPWIDRPEDHHYSGRHRKRPLLLANDASTNPKRWIACSIRLRLRSGARKKPFSRFRQRSGYFSANLSCVRSKNSLIFVASRIALINASRSGSGSRKSTSKNRRNNPWHQNCFRKGL